MKALRFAVPLAIFLALAGVFFVGLNRDPREVPSPLIGKPAPDFALATVHDPARIVRRADLVGRPWMLNVWASWCGACREEHPRLVEFAKRSPVTIVGLNYKDRRDDGLRWLGELGNPYALSLHDEAGRLGLDFGVYGVPETFVIDAHGTIRYKKIGPLTDADLSETVEPLLRSLRG